MSDKYYVAGCRSNGEEGEEIERCEDSEATFWTLYARDSEGLSEGIIDCAFREDAEAAMAVYVERDRLNEQVRALAAENLTSRNAVQAFCDVVQSNTDAISEEVGADGVRIILAAMSATGNMPATDTILNELRAQGCEMFVEFNRKLAKDYPYAMVAKALEVTELNGEQFAARIRAGEVPNV